MLNYNTNLYNNNLDLQTILDSIKGLPDEGVQVDESKIITKSATGKEYVCLNDVSEVPHNLSASVRNKNLFPYFNAFASGTSNGVTITNNGDGSFTVNGTSTVGSSIVLYNTPTSLPSGLKAGKTYRLSIPFENHNNTTRDLTAYGQWYVEGSNSLVLSFGWANNDSNKQVTDIVPNNAVGFKLYFNASAGVTFDNMIIKPQIEEGETASAYAPYIDDISTVTVKTYGENLYNAANWTTAPYYSFCNIGNFPWRLTLLDKDTSVDLSGIEFGVGQYSTSSIKAYSPFLQNKTIRWATKDNIATHPSSIEGKILLCECLYIYPNTQEALNKVLQRFDIMVTGVNIIPTKQAPYIEPITYPVSADGTVEAIPSISPNMVLIANGVHIDVTYRRSFGMQNEQERFWGEFQNYGNRTYYAYTFTEWTDGIYNPKYPIVIKTGNQGFYNTKITNTKVPITILLTKPVTVFSNATSLTTIPYLDISGATDTIDRCFNSCIALKTIAIVGSINANGFNVQWSNELTHDSLMSIINALADKSADTSGTTWTVTIGATNKAKLSEEELTIAANKGWTVN